MIAQDLRAAIDPVFWWKQYSKRTLHDYQITMLRSHQDLIANISRQGGKSTICAIKAVHRATFYPKSIIILISPTLDQSTELGRKCADICMITRADTTSEAITHIDFANKSRIICLPGSESSARSYSAVSLIVVDEASRVPDEVVFSVRPMLAASHGQMIMISTPFLKKGYYYEQYSNTDSHFEKITTPWYKIPHLSKEFIEQERKETPEKIFKMEYECQFLDANDVSVFNINDLDKCVSDQYEVIAI